MTLLMMGSADALPSAPIQKTKFVEDMSESELSKAVSFVYLMIRINENI